MNRRSVHIALSDASGFQYSEVDGPRWVHRPEVLASTVEALIREAVNEALEAAAVEIERVGRSEVDFLGQSPTDRIDRARSIGSEDAYKDAIRIVRSHIKEES